MNPSNVASYRLEPFFELSIDLHCIAGYDGYFKRINPAVSNLLGYTEEELFSKPIKDFILLEDKDITARHRENLINNNPLLNFENRYVTKSGEIVWLSWTSMPLHEEQLVYAIAKNITHKKEQEEHRNALLTHFAKINTDLKQLNYTTSHDLRAPVNNLLSIFSILDTTKICDPEISEFISLLKASTEKLKENLDNYVENLIQKDLMVQIEILHITSCLKEVILSVQSLIKISNTRFNIDFSAFEHIPFNRSYLSSIFLNLITNSIKYAQPDCPPVISIYTRKINGISQLIYSDNGLGFEMDQVKDKIFKLHQKFHHNTDSKGIGLYLVHNHITSLGGKIEVESKPNQGTTFTISFKD